MPVESTNGDLAEIDHELLDGLGEQLVERLLGLEARGHVELAPEHQPRLARVAVGRDHGESS